MLEVLYYRVQIVWRRAMIHFWQAVIDLCTRLEGLNQ